MVIRRGDVTDITRIFARLEMRCLITNQHIIALLMDSVISQLGILGSHKTMWGL